MAKSILSQCSAKSCEFSCGTLVSSHRENRQGLLHVIAMGTQLLVYAVVTILLLWRS